MRSVPAHLGKVLIERRDIVVLYMKSGQFPTDYSGNEQLENGRDAENLEAIRAESLINAVKWDLRVTKVILWIALNDIGDLHILKHLVCEHILFFSE